jgi:mercuric ion transport protein
VRADRLLRVGIVGTVVTALCCFTPVLVVLLGMLGLAALIGWLDLVLSPALVLSLLLIGYSLWTRRRTSQLRPRPRP